MPKSIILAIRLPALVAGCARRAQEPAGPTPAEARVEGQRPPLRPAGSVWLWGLDPTTTHLDVPRKNRVPARVEGLTGVVAVAVGRGYYLALMADGTVWASNARLLDRSDEPWPGNIGHERFVPGFVDGGSRRM